MKMTHAGDMRVEFNSKGSFFDLRDKSNAYGGIGDCCEIPLYREFAFYALVETEDSYCPQKMVVVPNEAYFEDWLRENVGVKVLFKSGKLRD